MTAYRVSVHALAKGPHAARLVVETSQGPGHAVTVVLRAAAWLGVDVAGVQVEASERLGTARADGVGWSVVAVEVLA